MELPGYDNWKLSSPDEVGECDRCGDREDCCECYERDGDRENDERWDREMDRREN